MTGSMCVGANNQFKTECPNCVPPKSVTCPQGYHKVQVHTSLGEIWMCEPDISGNGTSGGNSELPKGIAPPGSPSNRPSNPPSQGPFQHNPPSSQYEPGQERMLQESPPKGVAPAPQPPSINKLFVRYYGNLSTTGYTYMGGLLPCYAKLATGGNLIIWERYPSGRTVVRNFGWRPRGWNKFFFTGDQPGWHALTINVNGNWCNWIWIFVS